MFGKAKTVLLEAYVIVCYCEKYVADVLNKIQFNITKAAAILLYLHFGRYC